MTDRWIVSGYGFLEHGSLAAAEREAARLREIAKREFRIYRIKDTLAAGQTSDKIRALQAELAAMRAATDAARRFSRCAAEFDGDLSCCSDYLDALWNAINALDAIESTKEGAND